ncbi:MAG: mannitol-1-phosphate 5-dehydrogenase [Treponema sp.]|jgi:mannitol-1-phosphate 5-dehydrogenase|nr:mannitol-1-phosphate 5-dehydrogenase [Treponema sp.]
MKAVMYGAGNIGRGFIAPLFSRSGYRVTFIDVNAKIVNSLNEKSTYPVRLLSNEGTEEIWIEGVSAVDGANEQEVINCIAEADITATAVGTRLLPSIAPLIAGGLRKRFLSNKSPLNIIVCENLIDAGNYIAELISKNLDDAEIIQMKEKVGFVEASIGRMVPVQTPEMQEGNSLRICTEEYSFLPVNKDAFVGEIPEIEGMVPFHNFDFYIQRKLFIHNMGHALCAYLGLLLGDAHISETIARADVLFIVQNAMLESASALQKKFDVHLPDLLDHINDLLCRFNNRALKDTCARVGADIERKLGKSDRFIGAMSCCMEQGVTPVFISIGAAAATHCIIKQQGLEQSKVHAIGILEKISELERDSDKARLILNMYHIIERDNGMKKLLYFALNTGKNRE